METPAGIDPLKRARYDAAVQRYHDAVAIHRDRLESELRKAKDTIAELSRTHEKKRRSDGKTARSGQERDGASGANAGTARGHGNAGPGAAAGGPVRSILNRGG
ncbi:hypothetical protein [Corynebacterium xerosis]|nr:hypothetical protein [Corynebacterium xerosis]